MRRIIVFVFMLLAFQAVNSFAQKTKVLDKSKKRPEWVNGIVKDYIIAVGSGNSIETARDKALLKVKENIITSIAENIQTTSNTYQSEKTANGVTSLIDNYESSTQSKSADISYLKGISLSQVEDYYWEKVSEDGVIKYYYHLKYPFSELKLRDLVEQFEKADKELTDQLNTIIDGISGITAVEGIYEALGSLQNLEKSFLDQRKDKAELGITKLNEMLKSISIYTIENKLGEITYSLKLGDYIMTTAMSPKVTSNCAKITDIQAGKSECKILYDYSGCYDDPSNAVIVAYNFGPQAKKSFNIDINANKTEIFTNDAVNISSTTTDGNTITSAKCTMTITSKYDNPATIEKITINWGRDNAPIIIDNLNILISGKGKHDITFGIAQPLDKEKYNVKNQSMLSGTILYHSASGQKFTSNFSFLNVTTNW